MPKLKSIEDIRKMRIAGKLVAETLNKIKSIVAPGISTGEINDFAHNYIIKSGGFPTPLKYNGFPKSICTSINEVICHGIPSYNQKLTNGDIVNIDIAATVENWIGDASITCAVGDKVNSDKLLVLDVAFESLALAIASISHGVRVGDLGEVILSYAKSCGCEVVRGFTGHGIGQLFHEPDFAIPHYGEKGKGLKLVRGMTFTVEPMINKGTWQHRYCDDGITVVTMDGMPSAQFEHTLAIHKDGVLVLTAIENDLIVKRAVELGATILDSDNI